MAAKEKPLMKLEENINLITTLSPAAEKKPALLNVIYVSLPIFPHNIKLMTHFDFFSKTEI